MSPFAQDTDGAEWGKLTVLALWNHVDEDSRALAASAMASVREGARVVFAQLVNSRECVSDATLQELSEAGIRVVWVPSRFSQMQDNDPSLKQAVVARLREECRLAALAKAVAPRLDEDAASAVKRAYEKLPEASSAQRREFLDKFYGGDEYDDGVR